MNGDYGDRSRDAVDRPEQLVLADAALRELVGAHGDDADDGCADTVKHRLHPR
jgi:hypothetical protein